MARAGRNYDWPVGHEGVNAMLGEKKPKGFHVAQEMKGEKRHGALSLYGLIGENLDIDSSLVVDAISSLELDRLDIYMNSPGGDPFSGFAIANRLNKLQKDGQIKEIHTHGEAIVGSAATLPFLQGKTRTMLNGSRFFIHKGSAGMHISGTLETLPSEEEFIETYRNFRKDLETTNEEAKALYVAKSNLTADEVEQAMAVTTTYGPSEAVAAGFATHADKSYAVAACVSREQVMAAIPGLPTELLEIFDDRAAEEAKQAEVQKRADELRRKVFA